MIAIIAALDENRCIGRDGRLPWRIPGEQRRFRALTMGQAVLLGRRSFEEIGRALPGRRTIVLSRTGDFRPAGCLNARSLAEGIALAGEMNAYVCGGERLYAEALPLAEALYLTEIHAAFEGDRFFPAFDESAFTRIFDGFFPGDVPYSYVTYLRKRDSRGLFPQFT